MGDMAEYYATAELFNVLEESGAVFPGVDGIGGMRPMAKKRTTKRKTAKRKTRALKTEPFMQFREPKTRYKTNGSLSMDEKEFIRLAAQAAVDPKLAPKMIQLYRRLHPGKMAEISDTAEAVMPMSIEDRDWLLSRLNSAGYNVVIKNDDGSFRAMIEGQWTDGNSFRWRQNDGVLIAPADMTPTHLTNTISFLTRRLPLAVANAVWLNGDPSRKSRYGADPKYTSVRYLSQALFEMLKEAERRGIQV